MSLVGNLEDLSLGDIMQIISLSQKSGVLALEGEDGSGRIVFNGGLVQAASIKGRPDDLRGLLTGGQFIDPQAFDAFVARARELGLTTAETIAREGELSLERIEALIRESVEAAILEMFSWMSGDFSFDVRNKLEEDDPQLVLASGINAQYLAMEGMRIRDELSRDGGKVATDPNAVTAPGDEFPSVEGMFGDEEIETELEVADGHATPIDLEVDDTLTAADFLVSTVLSDDDDDTLGLPTAEIAEALPPVVTEVAPSPSTEAPPTGSASRLPVVLIDADMNALDWAKRAIENDFARVHVFQRAEQGLNRIRQYLIRGEMPIVVMSDESRIDPLSGIHGLTDFVDRLKTQAEKLLVLGLHREDAETSAPVAFDAVLVRPSERRLREGSEELATTAAADFVRALRTLVAQRDESAPRSAETKGAEPSVDVQQLRDATSKLKDASSRGEILPVLLDFAAEIFARVAILIVRDEQIFAIAGRGIEVLAVDPLDSSPPVSLQALDDGWIRNAIASGKPIQGPATTASDRELLACLGGIEPNSAYVGPIESGGATIAMLYCDQGTSQAGLPDTSGLDVVLQHAGLALDRAALERALWEADAEIS